LRVESWREESDGSARGDSLFCGSPVCETTDYTDFTDWGGGEVGVESWRKELGDLCACGAYRRARGARPTAGQHRKDGVVHSPTPTRNSNSIGICARGKPK